MAMEGDKGSMSHRKMLMVFSVIKTVARQNVPKSKRPQVWFPDGLPCGAQLVCLLCYHNTKFHSAHSRYNYILL